MATGSRFIKTDFGMKVLKQVSRGTYIVPTKILCLEKGKSELPKIDYKTYTCKPMDDVEYDVILNAAGSKVSISLDLALPKLEYLGGVEDLLLCCSMIKTDDAGDYHFAPSYDMTTDVVSMEVTTKRRTYQIKDISGTFTIDMTPGEMLRVKFTLNGTLNGIPTELSSGDPDNTIPTNYLVVDNLLFANKNCGIEVGANNVWAKGITLDLGRQLQQEETLCGDITVDSGMKSTIKISMKMTELNEAPIADMASGTEYTLSIPAYNNSNVEKLQLTAAKGKVSTPDTETDTNGYWDVERTFSLLKTDGNDNFDLVFLQTV